MIKGSANIKVYLVIGINKLGSRIIYKILISTSFVKQNYDEEHFSLTLSEWTLSYFLSGFTARKVSKYGVISGPYFPIFGLNTEICGVFLRIQPYYRKIRTRNNSVFGHFSCSVCDRRYRSLQSFNLNHLMIGYNWIK